MKPKKSAQSHTWKIVTLGMAAFVMVFGMAPVLGKNIQASLLTRPSVADSQPADEKEAVMLLSDFVDRCERLGVEDCARNGRGMLQTIGSATFAEMNKSLQSLRSSYGKQLENAACRFDLQALVFRASDLQDDLQTYSEQYGLSLNQLPLEELEAALAECS